MEHSNAEWRRDTLRVFESSETPKQEWVSRRWEEERFDADRLNSVGMHHHYR
jgi:hypothetical protein